MWFILHNKMQYYGGMLPVKSEYKNLHFWQNAGMLPVQSEDHLHLSSSIAHSLPQVANAVKLD